MGNICGKSESEAFSQPGRVLGSAPPQPQSVPVPAHVGAPAQTPGGGSAPAQGDSRASAADDARRRAAEAAEVCSNQLLFRLFFAPTCFAPGLYHIIYHVMI